jgi:hypothetical protein
VFVPAMDKNGKYLKNWWGELKFSVPDGMHRCVELVFFFKTNIFTLIIANFFLGERIL